MVIEKTNKYLFLQSSMVMGIILFLFYLVYDLGILSLIIDSDKSRISLAILVIYFCATIHWYILSIALSKQIDAVHSVPIGKDIKTISLMEDDLSNKHALGYMIVDILLKLGLTGTVIGFILMLLPIGEIKDFDTQIIQQLLSKMSGGMAVALYTTLTGLITSIFLRLQYFLLDSSLTSLINYLSSKLLHEE